MKSPRLRDSRKAISSELYHLNEIPDEIVTMIGGYFIYLLHVGRKDITGNDWGDAFARAIGGNHLESPLGIADVVKDRMAWSLKTVKSADPFKAKRIRLISGRCSPDFSYGIADPHKDIQQTGTAVLGIWNERVNIAYDHYNPVRTAILIRSNSLDKFCGVDPATRDYILDTILSNFDEGASVIISTHIISDIERILDDVIFIDKGKIVLTSSADELRTKEKASIDEIFRRYFKC